MCGISAFCCSKKTDKNKINEYFENLKLIMMTNWIRGKDATGIYGLGTGIIKDVVEANTFFSKYYKEINDLKSNVMLGHNRSSTYNYSKTLISNAHPHQYKGLISIHNGTVSNKYYLETYYKNKFPNDFDKTFDVDSEVLNRILACTRNFELFTNYEGTANMIIVDTNIPDTLFFHKDPGRTLFYGSKEEGNNLVSFVSSTKESLEMIGIDEVIEPDNHKIYMIKNGEVTVKVEKIKRKPIVYSDISSFNTFTRTKQTDIYESSRNDSEFDEDENGKDPYSKYYGTTNNIVPMNRSTILNKSVSTSKNNRNYNTIDNLLKNIDKDSIYNLPPTTLSPTDDNYKSCFELGEYVRNDLYYKFKMKISDPKSIVINKYLTTGETEILVDNKKGIFNGVTKEKDTDLYFYWLEGKEVSIDKWKEKFNEAIDAAQICYDDYIKSITSTNSINSTNSNTSSNHVHKSKTDHNKNTGCIVPVLMSDDLYWANGHLAGGALYSPYKGITGGVEILKLEDKIKILEHERDITAIASNVDKLNSEINSLKETLKSLKDKVKKHGLKENNNIIGYYFDLGVKMTEEEFIKKEQEEERIKNEQLNQESLFPDDIDDRDIPIQKVETDDESIHSTNEDDIENNQELQDAIEIADQEQSMYFYYTGILSEMSDFVKCYKDINTTPAIKMMNVMSVISEALNLRLKLDLNKEKDSIGRIFEIKTNTNGNVSTENTESTESTENTESADDIDLTKEITV